uniref:Uncharacterized protein n=1 Tax=Anguilla anguilla TaxID=7936 RepID=A0A0E9P6Y4_ANGAN
MVGEKGHKGLLILTEKIKTKC